MLLRALYGARVGLERSEEMNLSMQELTSARSRRLTLAALGISAHTRNEVTLRVNRAD